MTHEDRPIKKNGVLWHIPKWFPFLSPYRNLKRIFFFNIYCGNLATLLEVNLTILWGAPFLMILEIFHLRAIYQAFSSSSITVAVTPSFSLESLLRWARLPLRPCVSQILRAAFCLVSFPLLWSQEKILDVSVFSVNLLLGRSASFQLLIGVTEIQKLPIFLKFIFRMINMLIVMQTTNIVAKL